MDEEMRQAENLRASTRAPITADRPDAVFALLAFPLGYLFARWVMPIWDGWGTAAFTALYLAFTAAYILKKGIRPAPASWFWAALTLLTGLSCALWSGAGLEPVRALALFGLAVYWTLSASGSLLAGRTGNYLFFDALSAVFIIPFVNLANQYRSFAGLRRKERPTRRGLAVLAGALAAAVVLAVIIPMLLRADSGGFGQLASGVVRALALDKLEFGEFFLYCIPAVPVAAYLFGLLSGGVRRRGADAFNTRALDSAGNAVRFVPNATALIVLSAACGIYLVFIFSQLPYFFSAFTGVRPEGWLVYAEYARSGFFELCQIAGVNLALLLAANMTCKKPRRENRALKAFNIALPLITLLLIATAFSKMALYIGAYGLSMPRLLPCVFMLFLAAVFLAVIAMQKWSFSIMRFAAVTGASLLCALCLINPGALVARYNADRYLAGTLPGFDTGIVYRAGAAGVAPAWDVYCGTDDGALREELSRYFTDVWWRVSAPYGHDDNLEKGRVRALLTGGGFAVPPDTDAARELTRE